MDVQHLLRIGLPLAGAAGLGCVGLGRPAPVSLQMQPLPLAVAAASPGCSSAAKRARPNSGAIEGVGHGKPLPDELVRRIPASDIQILNFLLKFLESENLGSVPVYINGGYVRDLLLGKEPDDLDLSICLRSCAENVTVAGLLERLPGFAAEHASLGIIEVKLATILSNESKDKLLDTFKAYFSDVAGKKTEVDVMPTIGEEKYDEDNRIPIRDQRGTPEEDALRRDLTIGALLLQVVPSAIGLQYSLLDFYGGVEDIKEGVLRSPYPTDKSVAEVRVTVLRYAEEVNLATALGLDQAPDDEVLQVLWWAKVLMDDPVRICRALRFAAKLRFRLHDSFWLAVPFALDALRSKVAGSRKNTEYQKLAGYGCQASYDFFQMAFGRTFGGTTESRLASYLFGGKDDKGRSKAISVVTGFNSEAFRAAVEALRGVTDEAELIGGMLAAALVAADLQDAKTLKEEFAIACDGMCVSNAMREAGNCVLLAAERMTSEVPAPGRLEVCFAALCGISSDDLATHVQVWDALQLLVPRAGPVEVAGARHRLALALVGPAAASRAHLASEALAFERPPVKGGVLACPGLLEVPPLLRQRVAVLLSVALRLLRDIRPLETPEHLSELFAARPLLRDALAPSVWFEDDGKTLRPEFLPPKRGKK